MSKYVHSVKFFSNNIPITITFPGLKREFQIAKREDHAAPGLYRITTLHTSGYDPEFADWCNETFGNTWFYSTNGNYYFEKEQDLTAIMLRWG